MKLLLCLFFTLVVSEKVNVQVGNSPQKFKDDGNQFVPTSEWQSVEPGQVLPKGLHVRMNMQTGKTEAKLLDESDGSASEVLAVEQPETDSSFQIDSEELKKVISNMKGNKDLTPISENEHRSYEELKKDFEALNEGVKTDSQIMKELYQEYMQIHDDKRKLEILADLEYHVHQIDNGMNFVQMGGLRDIVKPGLNSSFQGIREYSAYLLGSCVQSNPKGQIASYEGGLIQVLVRLVAVDASVEVKNKALYALAVLCRNFPLAQSELVKTGAISSFSKILEDTDPNMAKIQLKIIALLYDLVLEPEMTKQQIKYSSSENETDDSPGLAMLNEKLQQYSMSNIKQNLLSNNWCPTINTFLVRIYETSVNSLEIDHDSVEKVLYFMSLLSSDCKSSFVSSKHVVESFKEQYKSLQVADNDEYFSKLYTLCGVILSQLKVRDEL